MAGWPSRRYAADVDDQATLFRPLDTELLHPEPQGVRMQSEDVGGIAGTVDPPPAAAQHAFDVVAFDDLERRLFAGAVHATGPGPSSSNSVSPVEWIIARSTTFSSSRTLPGHECCCSAASTGGGMLVNRRFSAR